MESSSIVKLLVIIAVLLSSICELAICSMQTRSVRTERHMRRHSVPNCEQDPGSEAIPKMHRLLDRRCILSKVSPALLCCRVFRRPSFPPNSPEIPRLAVLTYRDSSACVAIITTLGNTRISFQIKLRIQFCRFWLT